MKTRQFIGLAALALAVGSAFADEGSLSREQVRQDVIAARKAGTLIPAGQGVTPGYPTAASRGYMLSRAQVKADVLEARADRQLAPAGEGSPENRVYAQAVAAPSTLTRAEMKQEVLEARANGELIPAGEGEFAPQSHATHVARADGKSNIFALFHHSK